MDYMRTRNTERKILVRVLGPICGIFSDHHNDESSNSAKFKGPRGIESLGDLWRRALAGDGDWKVKAE